MIKVKCYDVMEIRMGSPYRICKIRLKGDWVPELPKTDWQNVYAVREDGNAAALIRWDTPGNMPGFRIIVVDCEQKTVKTSRRKSGCCRKILWEGRDKIKWEAFPDLEGTYRVKGKR